MIRNKISALVCSMLIFSTISALGQVNPKGNEGPLNFQDIGKSETIISRIDGENQQLKQYLEWMDNRDLNVVTLRQMGQQNKAAIQQLQDSKNPNLVLVSQQGNHNTTDIDQKGNHNAVDLRQTGYLNSHSATYEGEYLLNTIVQEGHHNVIQQTLKGSDMDFSIVQNGSGHEVIQIENRSGVGYKVTQTGRDMKISIEQGHVMVK